jgi:hypothetical protein
MLGKHLNHCENSLTAAVFTHLLHLPIELFWRILRGACHTDQLPQCPGEPLLVDPWPNWDPKGTQNSSRVVPDMFLRFHRLDLIIEAKRWDAEMQCPEQWRDQLTAYANQYAGESEPADVRLIALGGTLRTEDAEVVIKRPVLASDSPTRGAWPAEIKCPVHMCRWSGLLAECQRVERELGKMSYVTSQSIAHHRILMDLIDLFSWHGFQTGLWFADVVPNAKLLRIRAASVSRHMVFQTNKS